MEITQYPFSLYESMFGMAYVIVSIEQIVVFLCMSCLPYIIIKSTVPYSKVEIVFMAYKQNYNRKGKLIYHFFSDGEEK